MNMNKHVKPLPKCGYLRTTAEEFFPELKGLKRNTCTSRDACSSKFIPVNFWFPTQQTN